MTTIEYLIEASFDSACDVWSNTGVMKEYFKKEATKENCDKAVNTLTQYILDYNEGLEHTPYGKARISPNRAHAEAMKILNNSIMQADNGKSYIIGDMDGFELVRFLKSIGA